MILNQEVYTCEHIVGVAVPGLRLTIDADKARPGDVGLSTLRHPGPALVSLLDSGDLHWSLIYFGERSRIKKFYICEYIVGVAVPGLRHVIDADKAGPGEVGLTLRHPGLALVNLLDLSLN